MKTAAEQMPHYPDYVREVCASGRAISYAEWDAERQSKGAVVMLFPFMSMEDVIDIETQPRGQLDPIRGGQLT